MIEALYEASQAGVEIDLHRPRRLLPRARRRGRVASTSGCARSSASSSSTRGSGCSPTAARAEWYIGSADLMERNLDRRVEVVTPVEDHEAQARLARIIDVMLADDRRSWQLGPDGDWRRTEILESVEGTIDTFAVLKDDAATVGRRRRPFRTDSGVGAAGSMDPRA